MIESKLLSAEELAVFLSDDEEDWSDPDVRQLLAHIAAQAEQVAARDMEIERLIDQRDAAEEALSQASPAVQEQELREALKLGRDWLKLVVRETDDLGMSVIHKMDAALSAQEGE